MNDHRHRTLEGNMESMTEFETRLSSSAPQPREEFEQALGQRLTHEFAQQNRAGQPLSVTQSRRRGTFSLRGAVILAAILVIGVGIVIAMNPILQQLLGRDAGLQAILEQGRGHEIGLSQTHDGYTVTLEWAYADGNRLTLAYMIEGQPGAQYTNLYGGYAVHDRTNDTQIPLLEGWTALLDANGELLQAGMLPVGDRSVSVYSYDLSALPLQDRASLDLRLESSVVAITMQRRTMMPHGDGTFRIEGPIENFDEMNEGPDEAFVFDFSVAVSGEQRVVDSAQTATDQDITLTLERVHVTPSQTRVIVCYAPPDPARQWTSHPHLTTSAGEVPGGGGVRPYMDGDKTCDDFTYYAAMYDYSGEWRLEIRELIGFGSGGGNDQQRIAGSWVFQFTVP